MKRGLLVVGILMTLALLTACSPAGNVPQTELVANENPTAASAEHQITIAADGFSPKTITIKAGDTITFLNEDANKHWPASAMHPTHNVYPESGGCIGSKFDACKGLEQGESFSFTFNEKGSWKYHDHLSVSSTGTVVVE